MTADIPTLIARLRNRAAAWSDNPESAFDLDVADALEAQSTELAQMNDRIDVLAEERARRYHEGACRYQMERDAARAAIREALAEAKEVAPDSHTLRAILSRALQEGGN